MNVIALDNLINMYEVIKFKINKYFWTLSGKVILEKTRTTIISKTSPFDISYRKQ